MPSKTYGVAIIGTGRISGAHARAAQNVENARLVVASEIDEARGKAFAEKWNVEVVKDYKEILKRDDVDIVALTLPHWLHMPIGVEVMNAGKHVLVEKPMADSVEECDIMIEAARRNGVKLFTGHTEQFLAPNTKARQLIDSGEVGDVVMIADSWYKAFALHTRPAWFLDREKGGGMWLMNGAHMIDRITYISGKNVKAVKAFVGTRYNDIQADDAAMAYLELEGGVPATIAHTGYKDKAGAGVEQSGGEMIISCTEAMLKVDNRRRLFRSAPGGNRNQGEWQEVALEPVETATLELQKLIENIERNEPETVRVEQARHIVEAMTACEESSQTGREVVLSR
ncbi:MAG TPA: Gfo/Idh/MocA family oxidoreductase [Chloroflexota bacterium]|nr:Gfo/Idh/MocA family oxidoreductase [Chloroflexota bacterium]